jgi:hypothetical protein
MAVLAGFIYRKNKVAIAKLAFVSFTLFGYNTVLPAV